MLVHGWWSWSMTCKFLGPAAKKDPKPSRIPCLPIDRKLFSLYFSVSFLQLERKTLNLLSSGNAENNFGLSGLWSCLVFQSFSCFELFNHVLNCWMTLVVNTSDLLYWWTVFTMIYNKFSSCHRDLSELSSYYKLRNWISQKRVNVSTFLENPQSKMKEDCQCQGDYWF